MKYIYLMFCLCLPFVADATSVVEVPLADLIRRADHILVVNIERVDMVDGKGKTVVDPEARTGPGIKNTIRLHVRVAKDGVLYSTNRKVPDMLTIPLWTMWHYSLGQHKQQEGESRIFLLAGDEFQRVGPAMFSCLLSEKEEIEKQIKEHKNR